MTIALGTFDITSMSEDTVMELDDGGKITRATGAQRFTGEIEGDGTVEWLMCYLRDGTARFVGLQRITATIRTHTGSFVLESVGDHDGTQSKGTWEVIDGSGTGDFAGLRGEGTFKAPGGPKASFSLQYELG
jgi:hypothetical protein